jgi:hypothetical protein
MKMPTVKEDGSEWVPILKEILISLMLPSTMSLPPFDHATIILILMMLSMPEVEVKLILSSFISKEGRIIHPGLSYI